MTEDLAARLSAAEDALFTKLEKSGDVNIRMLYRCIFRKWPVPLTSTRKQQQMIGPYIARLNAKIEERGLRVQPGTARNTYCLKKTG